MTFSVNPLSPALGPEMAWLNLARPLFGVADRYRNSVGKFFLPNRPAIYRVSNKTSDGVPQGHAKAGSYRHSDVSFRERPASACLLYAIVERTRP